MDELLGKLDEMFSSIVAGTDIKSADVQNLELLQIFSKNIPEEERSMRASILLGKLKTIITSARSDETLLLPLLDSCLLNIIKNIYPQDDGDGLLEKLLDIISVLVDAGPKVQALIIGSLSNEYVGIITAANCPFGQKMEVLKSYNVLLESCPLAAKQELVLSKTFFEKMKHLFNLIFHIGDYEFQVGTLECIFRLVPRKMRPQCASKFIQNTELISAFLMIKDGNFETDCRSFLNCLNKQLNSGRCVLSVPCIKAVLGKRKLIKPNDPEYDEFWVDCNFGSKRLTIFCEQDSSNVYSQRSAEYEDMWETISIWTNDVESYQCLDSSRSMTTVTLVLKKNVTELFPHMVEAEGKELYLLFDDRWCVSEALRKTFGVKQSTLTVKKVSSVNEPLHLFMRNGSLQADSVSSYSPYPDSTVCNKAQAHMSQVETPLKQTEVHLSPSHSQLSQTPGGPKMSVPTVPMKTSASYVTPVMATSNGVVTPVGCASDISKYMSSSTVSNDRSSVLSTVKCSMNINLDTGSAAKDFKAPRTPQNKVKMRPKVKTPVVTIEAPRKKEKTPQHQKTTKMLNSIIEENLISVGQRMVNEFVIADQQSRQNEIKSGRKPLMDDSGIGLNESDLFHEKAQTKAQMKKKLMQDDIHLSVNETFVSDISDIDEVKSKSSQEATKKKNKKGRRKPQHNCSVTEKCIEQSVTDSTEFIKHKDTSKHISDKIVESQTFEPENSQQTKTRSSLPRQVKCGKRKKEISSNEMSPNNDDFVIEESQDFKTKSYKSNIDVQGSSRKHEATTLDNSTEKSSSWTQTKISGLEETFSKKSNYESKTEVSDFEIEVVNAVKESKQGRQKKKANLRSETSSRKTMMPELNKSECRNAKLKHTFDLSELLSNNNEEVESSETNTVSNSNVLNFARQKLSDTLKERKPLKHKESNTLCNLQLHINGINNTGTAENNCQEMLKNLNCTHSTFNLKNPPSQESINKQARLISYGIEERPSTVSATCTDKSRNKKNSEFVSCHLLNNNSKKQKTGYISDTPGKIQNKKQFPDELTSGQHLKASQKKVSCGKKKQQNDSQQFMSPTVADVFTNNANKRKGKQKHKLYTTQITQAGEFKLSALSEKSLCLPLNTESADDCNDDDLKVGKANTNCTLQSKSKKYSKTCSDENRSLINVVKGRESDAQTQNIKSLSKTSSDESESVMSISNTKAKDIQKHKTNLNENKLSGITSQDSPTNKNRSVLPANMFNKKIEKISPEQQRVLRKKKPTNKSLYVFDSPDSICSHEEEASKENVKPSKTFYVNHTPFKSIKTKEIARKPVSKLLVPSFSDDHSENSHDPYDFDAEIKKNSRRSVLEPWKPSQIYIQSYMAERKKDTPRKKVEHKERKKRSAKEQKSEMMVTINRWKSFSNGQRKLGNACKDSNMGNFGFSFLNSQTVQNAATDENEQSPEYPVLKGSQMALINSQYSIQETKRTETQLLEWTDYKVLEKSKKTKAQSMVKMLKGQRSVQTISTTTEKKKQKQKHSSEEEKPHNDSPKEIEYEEEPQSDIHDVLSNFSAACKNLVLESAVEESVKSKQEDDTACKRSEISWIMKKCAAQKKPSKNYQKNIEEKCRQILKSFTLDEDDLIMSSQESEICKISPRYRDNCNQNTVTPKVQPSRKKYSPLDVKVIKTPKTPKTPCSISWTDADDDADEDNEEDISTSLDQFSKKKNTKSVKYSDVASVKAGSTISKISSLKSGRDSSKSIISSKVGTDLETPVADFLRNEKDLIAVPIGIISGPTSTIRPSKSTLKRKYPEVTSTSEENEDESSSESHYNSQLIPRKLFKTADYEQLKKETPQLKMHTVCSTEKKSYVYEECVEESLHDGETTDDDVADINITLTQPDDVGGISTLLRTFGIDIQKQIKQKKSHLEKVTSGVLKSTGKHFGQLLNQQSQTRKTIMDNFTAKIMEELQELEKDIVTLKSSEEQAMAFFKSQLKLLEHNKVSQKTRLTNFKLVHDTLDHDIKEAQENDKHLQKNFTHVLKKDIGELQQKLLLNSQNKQLANVRKCLFGYVFASIVELNYAVLHRLYKKII